MEKLSIESMIRIEGGNDASYRVGNAIGSALGATWDAFVDFYSRSGTWII